MLHSGEDDGQKDPQPLKKIAKHFLLGGVHEAGLVGVFPAYCGEERSLELKGP